MSVGAQQVGEDEGVAGIALALGGRVARPRGFQGVGVDGNDGEAIVYERVDEQSGWPLDGDEKICTGSEPAQLAAEVLHSRRSVCDGETTVHFAGCIDHADSMLGAGPVDPHEQWHGIPPWFGLTVLGAGRPCRSLTDRRSGLQSPRRYTLWPVGTSRFLRWGGSHAGRRAASAIGPHRRGTGSTAREHQGHCPGQPLPHQHGRRVHQ